MTTHTLTRHLAIDPDTALRTIADVRRLPEWNAAIIEVLEALAALAAATRRTATR